MTDTQPPGGPPSGTFEAQLHAWVGQIRKDLSEVRSELKDLTSQINGSNDASLTWQARIQREKILALERQIESLKTLVGQRGVRIEDLEKENAELKKMIDPIKSEVEDWKQWRSKVLTAIVTGVVGLLVTAAGVAIWMGIQASVQGG